MLLIAVFLIELLIMQLLPVILPNEVDAKMTAIIDASVLSLVLCPLMFYCVIKPLKQLKDECDDLIENELSHAEQFNNLAAQTDGVFFQLELYSDGTYQLPFLNKQFESVYHLTQAELQNDPTLFFSLVHPEDITKLRYAISLSAQNLSVLSSEYRLQFKNGDVCKLSLNAVPRKHSTGTVIFRGFIKPIIENPELKLLRNIASELYGTPFGLVITDASNTIKQVNHAFSSITGYASDELVGQNMSLISSKSHDLGFYKWIWHRVHVDGEWQGEIWNRRKNGQLYLQRTEIFAIKNAQSEVINYVGLIYDITEINDNIIELEKNRFYQYISMGLFD